MMMLSKHLSKSIVIGLCALSLLVPSLTYAKKTIADAEDSLGKVIQKTGIEEQDLGNAVGTTIKAGLGIVGVMFFLLMIYAGITWMTAHGNEEQVEKARKTIIAAVIGLVIIVSGYAMTTFVQQRVINRQQPSSLLNGSGQVGDEPVGCCYDWVAATAITDLTGARIAARMTTYSDCKYWGETCTTEPPDQRCGVEGDGNWLFFPNVDSIQCEENRKNPSKLLGTQ